MLMITNSTCRNTTNHFLRMCIICCFFFPAFSKAQQDTARGHKYYDEAKAAWAKSKYSKAVKLYVKASDEGYLPANLLLADICSAGYYAKGGKPKALEYMARSANAGDPVAMTYIGNVYFTGDRINQNFDSAIVWFSRAAALDYPKAMYLLARMYDEGKPPPLRSLTKALYWYGEAAAAGDFAATYKMLKYKKDGEGLYNMWLTYKDSIDKMDVPDANIVVGLRGEASDLGCGRASNSLGQYYNGREYGGRDALFYFKRAVTQGFNVSDNDMSFAVYSEKADKNIISPQASKIGTNGNPNANGAAAKTQHKCPYCKGSGTIETAGSKSIDQDKNGRWQNTYTPRNFSTCSYCKGTGYY
jgi:TPR repeat protein